MPKHNDLEQKAFQIIMSSGNEGLPQSELWRKLGASSREGSRIALKLESKGLIRRERELRNGRWTYRLYPKRLPASIDSIADCPCMMCPDTSRCGSTGTITPQGCEKLTDWLIRLAEGGYKILGDS
ncbi:transcriptional regulator [Candidatus Bathyarchaeota archaeon]|nr:transcriptional regulator [Candidatus Bathyarchaeota archaeon]MBS7636986.1 transcriptional regulator [Candidatus Bathyarchaeota archaeon]